MFFIVEERMLHCDIGVYTSFGIAAGRIIVHDISPDRHFAESLVQVFNQEQLAPEHLRDAVEDAILLASMTDTGTL